MERGRELGLWRRGVVGGGEGGVGAVGGRVGWGPVLVLLIIFMGAVKSNNFFFLDCVKLFLV